MIGALVLLALVGLVLLAQKRGQKVQAAELPKILGPFSAATNHSDDIEGVWDGRPETWGKAGFNIHRYTFSPPPGYRVRILRVYGDFVAWVRVPGDRQKCAGVLWGLQTTAPEGSIRADYMADNGMVYLQNATCGDPVRAAFDFDVKHGGLLEPDNILISKVAVFTNDMGSIHLEPSFTLNFQWERE